MCAEYVLLEQKDKAILRRNRTGDWNLAELVVHDTDTAKLLVRVAELLAQLKEGRMPIIEEEKKVEKKRYVCIECGYSFPAFPEDQAIMRTWCHQCSKRQNFEKR